MNVFVDMDGVLCDFVGAINEAHGRPGYDPSHWHYYTDWGITEEEYLEPAQPARFWADLPLLPWAPWLCEAVVKRDPRWTIVTAPSPTRGCTKGKMAWVHKHVSAGSLPAPRGGLLFETAKHRLCKPGDLLIDDREQNIIDWEAAGGIGYLWPAPWNYSGKVGTTTYQALGDLFRWSEEETELPTLRRDPDALRQAENGVLRR